MVQQVKHGKPSTCRSNAIQIFLILQDFGFFVSSSEFATKLNLVILCLTDAQSERTSPLSKPQKLTIYDMSINAYENLLYHIKISHFHR